MGAVLKRQKAKNEQKTNKQKKEEEKSIKRIDWTHDSSQNTVTGTGVTPQPATSKQTNKKGQNIGNDDFQDTRHQSVDVRTGDP